MRSALLVVDVQEAMDDPRWGRRNNPELLPNLGRLLAAWRERGWPVVIVADDEPNPESPYHPGKPGNAFKAEVAPREGEYVVRKTTGDAFAGTELEEVLRLEGVGEVVVGGFMTHKCVAATVRGAAERGWRVAVVVDATAAVGEGELSAEEVHARALRGMETEARVLMTGELVG